MTTQKEGENKASVKKNQASCFILIYFSQWRVWHIISLLLIDTKKPPELSRGYLCQFISSLRPFSVPLFGTLLLWVSHPWARAP